MRLCQGTNEIFIFFFIHEFQLMGASAPSTSHPDAPAEPLHRWGLGLAIMASTHDIATAPSLPPRLRDGITAAQRIGID